MATALFCLIPGEYIYRKAAPVRVHALSSRLQGPSAPSISTLSGNGADGLEAPSRAFWEFINSGSANQFTAVIAVYAEAGTTRSSI